VRSIDFKAWLQIAKKRSYGGGGGGGSGGGGDSVRSGSGFRKFVRLKWPPRKSLRMNANRGIVIKMSTSQESA